MNDDITCVFALTLREGKFPAFRDLVAKIVTTTKQEPGTLSYVYSVSADEKNAHIVERYNADAVVSHVDETFAPFAEEFLSLVTIDSLTVYGRPSQFIRTRLDPFGAVYLTPFDGFTR